MLDQRLVFLDLETTGATAIHDRITEVGLVEVDHGRLVGEWSTLVNPGISIPPAIRALTGITDEMVASAPTFAEISRALHHRLDGQLLIAHNARFDYGFLRNEFRRAGIRYCSRVLCTVKLSRRLFPYHQRHNLDTLMMRHGVACDARHRALGDARVLWQLVQRWQHDLGAATLASAAQDLTQAPEIPAGLPDNAFDDIPEAPGIYIFYGEHDVALYIGKGSNLRSRVLSHFSGDHRSARDMRIAQQVKRLDWVETAGELGAMFRETHLVRQLDPVHNQRLQSATDLCSWHWPADDPERAPQLVSARDLDLTQLADCYGLFRSPRAALKALREIAAAHELCPIVTGLENGPGACSAHPAGRCRGACIGGETRVQHALRVGQAFTSIRMRPWPFRGRIGVRETGPDPETTELHVLDRWCYLGTVRSEQELHELAETRTSPPFDLDTYKILTRFLGRRRGSLTVIDLAGPVMRGLLDQA
jgi:DNA polymerase-3 subunit epsilon